MNVEIICADVMDWCESYTGPPAHAILCDPSYAMSKKKKLDMDAPADAEIETVGDVIAAYHSLQQWGDVGFMNREWDNDVAFNPETWRALARHLYPGGFIMAFASSRGDHRMAVAMEDAGLRIHPKIFCWAQGCLSEDTEILTTEGWKTYRDNLTEHKVMCYNVTDSTFVFMPVQEVFEYEISDTAFRIQSDSTDQIVTRNHRCLVERGGKFVFKQAIALECQEKIPILESLSKMWDTFQCNELRRILQEKPLFSKMCQGNEDGESLGRTSQSGIPLLQEMYQMWRSIFRSEFPSIPSVVPMSQVSPEMSEKTGRQDNNLSYLWQREIYANGLVAEGQRANLLKKMRGQTQVTKHVKTRVEQEGKRASQTRPSRLDKGKLIQLFTKNERSQQSSVERRGNILSQERKLWTAQNQVCSLSRGVHRHGSQGRICDGTSLACSTSFGPSIETLRGCSSQRPQPRKQRPRQLDAICQQQPAQEIRGNRKPATTLATVTPIHYKGVVWCVKVPTGAFVARRNGKIFITGNSGFPKATRIDTQIDARWKENEEMTRRIKAIALLITQYRQSKEMTRQEVSQAVVGTPSGACWNWEHHQLPSLEMWDKIKQILDIPDRFDALVEGDRSKFIEAEREVVGKAPWTNSIHHFIPGEDHTERVHLDIAAPATDLARAWQGHRYGLQALKPAVEPIIVAQKPYSGKPVDSIVETGAGALWIDGGRVATGKGDRLGGGGLPSDGAMFSFGGKYSGQGFRDDSMKGRWPPNFALCHIPSHKICQSCQAVHPIQPVIEVCDCGGELEFVEGCKRVGVKRVKGKNAIRRNKGVSGKGWKSIGYSDTTEDAGYADLDGKETVDDWECAEECPARRLDEQAGDKMHGAGHKRDGTQAKVAESYDASAYMMSQNRKMHRFGDDGGPSRFYPQAGWEHEEMECSPSCPIAKLDEQAGERPTGNVDKRKRQHKRYDSVFPKRTYDGPIDYVREGSSGGASRFYPNADWTHEVAEQLAQADPVHYCPKSPKKERQSGLDDFYWRRDKASLTGFVRISQEEWEMLDKKQRARGNIHSTVKPLSLLKWLATLLLPPLEYAPRRILVPFAGSGSEAIAAALIGFEEVIAIELLQDYVDIAEARKSFWLDKPIQLNLIGDTKT